MAVLSSLSSRWLDRSWPGLLGFLDYKEQIFLKIYWGKTFGPLSMTLTPAQCHSEEGGKRKEAMGKIKGAEICP